MKKKNLLTALFVVLVTVANAASNFGIVSFGVGDFQTAKTYFEQQVSQSPAESNYYLGEIAFAQGKSDEAKAYYEKGIAASPIFMLNYVGQAKLLLKSDPKAAELGFATALKKNKKDSEVNVAIARAYYECGMKDIALVKIEAAKKFGKKSPLVYTLEGDMLKAENKFGEAAGKYEQAIYFDPSYTVASIKCAQVYEAINSTLSIEILKKVIAEHPDYKIAYRDLGRSYTQNGQYQSAIEAFKTFFATGKYNVDDITKFASAYYFTDQYPQSIELVNEGLQLDSANFVLNRFRMYNAAKVKDTQHGVAYADYFFTLKSVNGTFIPLDYTTYATILSEAGQFTKALDVYNKVLETDPTRTDLYKEIFAVYSKMGENVKAAEIFQKYIDLVGADNVEALDFYQLGRAYYAAGTSLLSDSSVVDKAMAKDYLIKADTIFGTVSRLIPDSYTGYLWRGHANAAMDPETTLGLAKPYYEAAINSILSKSKETGINGNKKDLILAYRYLGYYFYLKEDKANSAKYWNLILELEPNNATAKQVLDSYKEVKK